MSVLFFQGKTQLATSTNSAPISAGFSFLLEPQSQRFQVLPVHLKALRQTGIFSSDSCLQTQFASLLSGLSDSRFFLAADGLSSEAVD